MGFNPEMSVTPPEHGHEHNTAEIGGYPLQQIFDFRSAPLTIGQSSNSATANLDPKPTAADSITWIRDF
jgi:hypothetical protein